jgi:ABC-type multidrug transport system fused ATPase/permease subunit
VSKDAGATIESARSAVAASWSLLSVPQRKRYLLVVLGQVATGALDLAGVLLLGLVGLLAATTIQGGGLPPQMASALSRLGYSDVSVQSLTIVVAIVGSSFLLLKSVTYGYLVRRIYLFLGRAQASVGSQLADSVVHQRRLDVEARSSQEAAFALTGGLSAAFLGVLGSLAVILSEASLLIALAVVLVAIDPVVTIAAVIFLAAVGLGVQRGLSSWSQELGGRLGAASVDTYRAVQEAVAANRELYVADRRDLLSNRISRLIFTLSTSLSDSYFASQIPKFVYEAALVVGALLLTGWQFLSSDLVSAITTLAVFLVASSRIIPSMLRISVQSAALSNAAAQATTTYRLADEIGDSVASSNQVGVSQTTEARLRESIDKGFNEFDPTIRARALSFTYPGGSSAAVEGASFMVSTGSSLALVGGSGAGKSTLADILLGVLDPEAGDVTIGGMTPREAIKKWPGGIGYVPQSVVTFDGTIKENVALGFDARVIDEGLVWEALERAQLASFVRDLSDGLGSPVGERGVNLSGGQRQRLGLARALYSRPRLLVLDEATSALDAETEAAITRVIAGLAGDVTLITIAHRLVTVQHADQVVFLEGGKLIASGTFSEVRARAPQFDRQARLLGL